MPGGAGLLSRLFRSPVVRFLVLGAVMLVALSFVTGAFAKRAAEREAIAEASTLNSILARALAKPSLTSGLLKQNFARGDRLDRSLRRSFLENESLDIILVGLNVWDEEGRLLYTDRIKDGDRFFLGKVYPLGDEQRRVLARGGTSHVLLDEQQVADGLPLARGQEAPLKIFTRIGPGDEKLLFEGFYATTNLDERREEIYAPIRWITFGGMALLLLFVTPLIWVLTRQLASAAAERERLLQTGLDASDAERRRVARDLHDGVVQDLAGASFRLTALTRDQRVPQDVRHELDDVADAQRDMLKSLRSLVAEIHPPEIPTDGLLPALEDLIAPAATRGMQASVSVQGAEAASDEQASLLLRVAQEAVRNALRHSGGTTLAVTVWRDGGQLVLEVVDDGVGFDPAGPRAGDRYGLRGMTTLARDRGGRLTVTSSPGEGTAVRLEVDVDGDG